MTSIVAFDSKEFNIPGRVRDFFCPLGIGLEILDKDRFNASYRTAVRELRDRNGIRQKRTVFDSSTLQRLLGGIGASERFIMTIIDEVRPYLGQAIIFHTTIPPRKVPRLYV